MSDCVKVEQAPGCWTRANGETENILVVREFGTGAEGQAVLVRTHFTDITGEHITLEAGDVLRLGACLACCGDVTFSDLNPDGDLIATVTLANGQEVDLKAPFNPEVVTGVQATPTPTGNIENLNSVFKDAAAATWFVDHKGNAILMGASVFKALNRFVVDPGGLDTNNGADGAPFKTVQAAVAALGQGDIAVVNEGVYTGAVTMALQNTSMSGADGTVNSLTQIASLAVTTVSGTSNRVSDITILGAVTHTGGAPLYLHSVTVGGNYTSTSTAYEEINNCRLQDGTTTKTTTGILYVKDSLIGTANFNTAGSIIAFDNVTIDAGKTVTIGAGVIYSNNGTRGHLVIHPDAVPLATAALDAGLIGLAAKSTETATFNDIRLTNVPTITTATKMLVRDVNGIVSEQVAGAADSPNITYQANSDSFPASPKRADTVYVTTNGTRTGSVTEEWVYDGVGWTFVDGSVAVSGAVIDNTITDSALITTVGRYIVPATGLVGAFVGQANKYADWSGDLDETDPANPVPTNFVFVAPTSGDKVSINSGTNAGTVWSFNGTVWTQQAGTVGVPAAGQLLTITDLATITSAGAIDSPWSNVAGGQFTIGTGKWDVEYVLAFTAGNSSNWVQARIVNLAGVEVAGSRAIIVPFANSPATLNGNMQIEVSAASTYRLQARTFSGSTITINNTTATTGAAAQRGQSVIKWTKAVEFPPVVVDPTLVIPQQLSRLVVGYSASSTVFPNGGTGPIGVNAVPVVTGSRFALDGNTIIVRAGTPLVRLTGPTSGSFGGVGDAVFYWALEGQTTKYAPPNSTHSTGIISSMNSGTSAASSVCILEFTLTTDVRLILRVASSIGNFALSNAHSVITVEELPTMTITGTVDTALTPVNDQSNSGYYDIGNVRHQWGRDTSGNASTRTITLPAPFANTGYSITYGCDYNADNLVRSGNTVAKTTTSFTARCQQSAGGSTVSFDWIAIGRKP
jgi:hypothetical protein